MLLVYLGLALVGYLIGATPVGVLVAGSRQIEIRTQGSGEQHDQCVTLGWSPRRTCRASR